MGFICDVHYVFHSCLLSLLCGIAKLCPSIQVSSRVHYVHYPFSVPNRYKASCNTAATVMNSPLCSSCFVVCGLAGYRGQDARLSVSLSGVWALSVVGSRWTVYCSRIKYECSYFREEVDGLAQLSQWMLQRFAEFWCRLALWIFSFGLGHLRDYVTPWSRLPCGWLNYFRISPPFVEREGTVLCSNEPATGYVQLVQSASHIPFDACLHLCRASTKMIMALSFHSSTCRKWGTAERIFMKFNVA